jgi:dextranase
MIYKKMQILILILTVFFQLACQKAEDNGKYGPNSAAPDNPETPVYMNLPIRTDKAVYNPGDDVMFSMDISNLPDNTKVRYKYADEIVGEVNVSGSSWKWNPPLTDFRGYMAEIYSSENEIEKIHATIGIDVSSDWTKFPRYGFISEFPQMSAQETDDIIGILNRYHINGLQFYDWHNKHHQPLPVVNDKPANVWKDIGNRDIYFETVENYIASAHNRNMKTMFYNLVYGAWQNAEKDGVKKEWYIYNDNTKVNQDILQLQSPPFISNLFLLDPANSEWQQYISNENQKVYQHLDFDGYHMDQLGDRGTRYTYNGNQVNLDQTFLPFIEAIKSHHPDKYLVMNAVNQYGQQGIAKSSTGFLYTEVWSPNDKYSDLADIIQVNNAYSSNTKNTVLAAYMNYDLAETPGFFNTPAVLLTDAVIFAFGGSHLELGEHMLGKEYFPNNNLKMKGDLQAALPDYYDFMVAYQNLLRDGGAFNTVSATSLDGKLPLGSWPAGQGSVASVCRKVGNKQVIHLINFKNSKTQEWRDNQGIQAVPALIKDAQLAISVSSPVRKIWMASPDVIGGASRGLNFKQSNDQVIFTLPELKYWSMIVLEYE